jgi:hypothetical protein
MRFMGWSWSDLMEAPPMIVQDIIKLINSANNP